MVRGVRLRHLYKSVFGKLYPGAFRRRTAAFGYG